MQSSCGPFRSTQCEDGLLQVEAAGPACRVEREQAQDLARHAQAVDARLADVLREANRVIQLRTARCEAQNRGTTCKDWKWQRKEWSTPPRPSSGTPMSSIFGADDGGASGPTAAGACIVGTYDRCPSTRARDPQTLALSKSFDASLARIDDDLRRAGVCEAWRAAATWCDRASIYVPPGQDASAP
jgi:hypothetical protein